MYTYLALDGMLVPEFQARTRPLQIGGFRAAFLLYLLWSTPDIHLSLNVHDLKTCSYLCRRPHGGGDGAIFCVRELYGIGKGFFRNAASMHDMVNVKCQKLTRVLVGACAGHHDI